MSTQRRFLPSTAALAAFEAVARRGSFTDAAEELSLTQSAVSRQIKQLEAQLDCPLFARTSRHVELTPKGRDYAAAVGEALRQIRQASVQLMTGTAHDVLRLAVLPTFGTRWLMPRISGFLDLNPGITFDMISRIGRFDLRAEGIDVAIQNGTMDWPEAECTRLMDETLAPVASPGFVAEHPVQTPGDLRALPLLHLHSRPGAWAAWFRAQGQDPPRGAGMRFEQFATTAQACAGGIGVALMPLFLIRQELAAGELVTVGPSMVNENGYVLVQPARGPRDAPAERFRSWLLETIRQERDAQPA